jgi:site-specific DNA-methyltransferase (adenine-specific)
MNMVMCVGAARKAGKNTKQTRERSKMSHKRSAKIATPKDSWETPLWLFNLLDQEYHFDCDAAAKRENSKCTHFFCDALTHDWYRTLAEYTTALETFYLNPPYSAGNIDKFMAKAYEESQKGALVVCLVPVASDTAWWHKYVMHAQEIRFIKGRVRFVGYDEEGNPVKNSPTFSSCVVVFWQKEPECINDPPVIGKTIEQPRRQK